MIAVPRRQRHAAVACRLLCTFPLLLLATRAGSAQSADLVLRHSTIYTGDPAHRVVSAVAVRAEKIVYAGSDAGVARFIGPNTKVIDLSGQFVYPGLVDSHAHFPGIGEREMTLNLEGTPTRELFLARVEAAVKTKKPGEW